MSDVDAVVEQARLLQVSFRRPGHAEMSDLITERSDVIEYLTGHGWDVSAQPMREAYAANGFEFPDHGATGLFAEMSYLSAVKR